MNRMAWIRAVVALFAGVVPGTAGHWVHGKAVARPQPTVLWKVEKCKSACGRGRAPLVAAREGSGMERHATAFEAQTTEQWTMPASGASTLRLRSDIQGATVRCRFRLAAAEEDQLQISLVKKARAETQARAQTRLEEFQVDRRREAGGWVIEASWINKPGVHREGSNIAVYYINDNILELDFIIRLPRSTRLDLSQWNLSLADLSGQDLRSVGLRSPNMQGATLTDANLERQDLSRMNLGDTNLVHCNLAGADLSHTHLAGANLRGANLAGANLASSNLTGADLRQCVLTGADLSGADMKEADLTGTDLSHTRLDGANLKDTRLERARLP